MESEPPQTRIPRNVLAMVVVMMCGSFLSALNQNLMNTALPSLMSAFGVTASQVQWVITVYALAAGVMFPATAYFVGRFRTRVMYFTAMGLFGIGVLLCAVAPVFEVLLVGRVFQALGAGMSTTLIQTTLFTVFPPAQRGTAMGFFGLVIAFAPALGPAVAGFVVDSLSWRALFVLQLPILLLLLVLALFLVKDVSKGGEGRLDVPSVILSTTGFGGVLYGFGSAGSLGLRHPAVLGTIVVGLACLAVFIRRQLRLTTPILDFRTFASRGFVVSLLLSVGMWCVFIVTAAVLPLFMQDMNGFTATQSGLAVMGGGIVMGVTSPVVGRIFDRFGPRVLVPVGLLLTGGAEAAFAVIGTHATLPIMAAIYVVLAVGLSLCNTPLVTTTMNTVPSHLVAHGSAMNNTFRQTGSAIATAIAVSSIALIAGPTAQGQEQIPGARAVFVGLAVICAVLCVVAVAGLGGAGSGRTDTDKADKAESSRRSA